MKLYSTNNKALRVPFEAAVFSSMPEDKGLYMPVEIPQLSEDFISGIADKSMQEIAFEVAFALLKDEIPEADLRELINDAVNFEAPLVALDEDTFVLELFHGPSLAFKDFGARFMSRVMAYFTKPTDKMLDVLVATSGDTGGAVALGFLGVPNTRVTILYPEGKVSPIQELQLTTLGKNIRAIAVKGTFDDCQALVKQAFADAELAKEFRFTSANSINILRLIPQTFYYFNTYAELRRKGLKHPVFVVPSGNFGNIGAAMLAYRMGLPVSRFVAATNVNDTVPRFLETEHYTVKPTRATLSNAMDVSAPSNWVRIMDLFEHDMTALKELLKAYSFTDADTRGAINELYKRYGYIACPHTAIAWLATMAYKKEDPLADAYVFLSTAHPCKFPDVFPEEIALKIEQPESVLKMEQSAKQMTLMHADFEEFRRYLTAY